MGAEEEAECEREKKGVDGIHRGEIGEMRGETMHVCLQKEIQHTYRE